MTARNLMPRALLWRYQRSARSRLAVSLGQVADRLDGLARTTESDFLQVGGRLEVIGSRARREASTITDGFAMTCERNGPVLAGYLEEVGSWTADAARAGSSEPLFVALEPVVQAAGAPLKALQDTVRVLRVLGMATRIESSWLGGHAANFEALADEVRSLADGIEEKTGALMEARDAMSKMLRQARETAAGQERKQQLELGRLTAECSAGLEELRLQHERVSKASDCARVNYEQVAADIHEIVTMLQTHDSVRQRLEHVVEQLKQLKERLTAPGGKTIDAADTVHAINLQAAQLRHARESFLSAVAAIKTELGRIREAVADYPRLARDLSRRKDGDSGSNRTSDLEHCLATISATMEELAESRSTLSAAAGQVHQACSTMLGFVRDIEGLGARLMRLAFNAEVQAVQLTDSGAVMESVAESIRRVAQDASESARLAGTALRELEPPAARMQEALARDNRLHLQEPQLIALRILEMSRQLSGSREESGRILTAIAEGGESLIGEIEALRAGITADRVASEVSSSCLRELDDAAAWARIRAGRMLTASSGEGLEDARANYTMRAERAAHDTFLGLVRDAGFKASPIAEGAVEGFGENVELF